MTVLRHVWPLIVTRTGARTRPKTAGTSTGTTTNVPDPFRSRIASKRASGMPRAYKPDRRPPPARYCPSGMQTASALDILVVDDDAPLRDMLTRSFEREGHRVTAVADGARGARTGRPSSDFDVVLLDVALGAGPGRPRRRPRAARAPQRRADHHAHRARQRGRRRPGPRGRRRRLRHQAVRPGRAAQPHPRRAAPRARAASSRASSRSARSRSTSARARSTVDGAPGAR